MRGLSNCATPKTVIPARNRLSLKCLSSSCNKSASKADTTENKNRETLYIEKKLNWPTSWQSFSFSRDLRSSWCRFSNFRFEVLSKCPVITATNANWLDYFRSKRGLQRAAAPHCAYFLLSRMHRTRLKYENLAGKPSPSLVRIHKFQFDSENANEKKRPTDIVCSSGLFFPGIQTNCIIFCPASHFPSFLFCHPA